MLLSMTAIGLQGCVESSDEDLYFVLQECDATPSSVDPDTGLTFYECSSPWRAVPDQPLFAWSSDCEAVLEIEQENDPVIVRTQPDIDGRSILLRCDSVIV